MIEILAYHGWGHDSSSWSRLSKLIDTGIELKTWDRGYFFDNRNEVIFSSSDSKKILMAHSFGLYQIPTHLFQKADGIIMISCFLEFGREKILSRMKESIKTNTALVLGQYHANCSFPSQSQWSMPRIYSKQLLMDDLEKLDKSRFNPQLIPADIPKLLLAGDNDKFVDSSRYDEFAGALGITIDWLDKSGHGILYTKAEIVAQKINSFLRERIQG